MCACSATGTGKTIAFLVPLLECLLKKQWTKHCGLGALVITPTRELAYQTLEAVYAVGGYHSFSVALLIGGRNIWALNSSHLCTSSWFRERCGVREEATGGGEHHHMHSRATLAAHGRERALYL